VAPALLARAASAPETDQPKDVGLLERTTSRLAQIDVTVSGPKDAIAGLTVADFEVRLNDKLVPNLIVDALCGEPAAGPRAAAAQPPAEANDAPAVATEPGVRPAVVSYLFYFDQAHLTQAGRRASMASVIAET
jgi:hypothetical protein